MSNDHDDDDNDDGPKWCVRRCGLRLGRRGGPGAKTMTRMTVRGGGLDGGSRGLFFKKTEATNRH